VALTGSTMRARYRESFAGREAGADWEAGEIRVR